MKTCKRILAVLLMLSCVFLFASCGTFGGIKKNFEDAGWTLVELADDEDGSRTANTIVAEMEEGDISCTLHIFKKDNTTALNIRPESVLVAFSAYTASGAIRFNSCNVTSARFATPYSASQ